MKGFERDRRTILTGTAALGASIGLPGWIDEASAVPAREGGAAPVDRAALMAAGISAELAAQRGRTLSDLRYDIRIDITDREVGRGSVRIVFKRNGSEDLILDFRGRSLESLAVNGKQGPLERTNGHVRIPAALLKAGENVLEAGFTTAIGPSGAAMVRFDDPTDGTYYLYTLLVPQDSHLLLPCFDQPDLKGRVRWTVTAPKAWTVVANSKIAAKVDRGDTTTWDFNRTVPIPLYVMSIAAGPWKAIPTGAGTDRPLTIYARPSRAAEIDAEAFAKTNRDTVAWLGKWLARPFPFEKLDLVFAPAFPFGGMENVGAVFYNENSSIFREPPTTSQRLGRDFATYHEVSHQWFGDLVTMRWFDDLWLKEGFSTFIAYYLQAALQPETGAWKTFHLRMKPSAYNTDVSAGTNPLWQSLANLNQAGSNYGPIVYNKAPAVIRQLAFLVGDDRFQKGLQLFVRRHAYGAAAWRDLLAAIETASGIRLEEFGRRWILQAGLPRVTSELDLAEGRVRRLTLRQAPANPAAGSGPWPMKVQLRLGYHDREDVVVPVTLGSGSVEVVAARGLPEPDFVWANDGDYGYGIFPLDPRSAAWATRNVGGVKDPLLRAMLWSALWEEVREGRTQPLRYNALVTAAIGGEADEQVASSILGRAATAITQYTNWADAAATYPQWEAFLTARASAPELDYGLRKGAFDLLLRSARSEQGLATLRQYLSGERMFDGKSIRQVSRWAAVTQLVSCGVPDAAQILAAEVARDTSADAARQAFTARAAMPDRMVKTEYFQRYLNDKTLNEGWATGSMAVFNDPNQGELTESFLAPALEQLERIKAEKSIAFLPVWISAFVSTRTTSTALETINRFIAARPELPIDIRRKLLEARDEVARTVRLRQWSDHKATLQGSEVRS